MKPLVILTGPTAVGKSEMAVRLAKRINGSVISADSMQVYIGMDIGSAKISKEEMQGVKHYLIDCLEPTEDFNVAAFKRLGEEALNEIYSEGKIPIICGGTGFYIQALLYDIDFSEDSGEDSVIRDKYLKIYKENGAESLHEMLRDIDPVSYETIHQNNVKRVIRALEFYEETGTPISLHNETEREKTSSYDFSYYVLNDHREKIYERIDKRVDKMIDMGLVHEVEGLVEKGLTDKNISMQGLGYKEIIKYLSGELTLDEAIYIIKRDSRHFAKRQITWFKRERDVIWLNRYEFKDDEEILSFIIDDLKNKNII